MDNGTPQIPPGAIGAGLPVRRWHLADFERIAGLKVVAVALSTLVRC